MYRSQVRFLVWALMVMPSTGAFAAGSKYPPSCDLDAVISVIERRLAEQEHEWRRKRQEVDQATRRALGRALSEKEPETLFAPARSADSTDTRVAPPPDTLDPPFDSISADADLPSGQEGSPTLRSPGVPISIPKAPRVPSFQKKKPLKPKKPKQKKSALKPSEKATQPAFPPTEQTMDTPPPSSSDAPTLRARPRDENQLPTLRSEE